MDARQSHYPLDVLEPHGKFAEAGDVGKNGTPSDCDRPGRKTNLIRQGDRPVLGAVYLDIYSVRWVHSDRFYGEEAGPSRHYDGVPRYQFGRVKGYGKRVKFAL